MNAALFERILGISGKKGLDSDDLCRGTESMSRHQGATAKTSAAHWHHYIIEVLHLFIDFERAGGCPGDYLEIIVWVDKSRACLARHTAALSLLVSCRGTRFNDFCPVAPHCIFLDRGCIDGHDDSCLQIELSGDEGECLGMVA